MKKKKVRLKCPWCESFLRLRKRGLKRRVSYYWICKNFKCSAIGPLRDSEEGVIKSLDVPKEVKDG